MHTQPQSSSEFGLIGNLQHVEQQRLTRNRRTDQPARLLDSHEAKSGLSSQFITEKRIQRGIVQHRRHYSELGIDPDLQHIHKSPGLLIKICVKIRSDQLGAESPEAATELQLSAFHRGAFPQGPGHKQKMTHWAFIAEDSAGGCDTWGTGAIAAE